jgi:hypothetical protein
MMGSVMHLQNIKMVKVCGHLTKTRFLFRDEQYEFLRCEHCGQIVRLPL